MAEFLFRGMDYSPWSSKNLIDRNRLIKFMQVGIDVKFMHTGLLGVVSSVSEIWLSFKYGQISIVIEKFDQSESAQKIHASRG